QLPQLCPDHLSPSRSPTAPSALPQASPTRLSISHHTVIMNAHADKHLLRVLVVDDNALNLSVLTRLLKKKFSDILDGPPVAVDSGLKALQLLRSNVFDVILMDIEMPFLSGVDCTKRIRAGQDGVLQINRTARIVAVTTAVGDEPEILYRRTGFDGLIGKPVVYDSINELLAPLSS
ncbi:CheY-like protein, partial [Jaminaea rosea]